MPLTIKPTKPRYSVLFNSAKLALNYHRSRSSSFLQAIRAFIHSEKLMLARVFRLGWRQHIELARVELDCAHAGLNFPHSNKLNPPWTLTDNFCTQKIMDLPSHPLIEPSFLAQLVDKQSSVQSAIKQLLQPEGLTDRWREIPIIDFSSPINSNARIAVCLHLFYPELWPSLKKSLDLIPEPWDLYISVPEFACTQKLADISKEHPNIRFFPCINRGRDVLPFVQLLNNNVFHHYDAVCKVHTKKSPHTNDGNQWLQKIVQSLLADKQEIALLLKNFRSEPSVGLIGPKEQLIEPGNPLHHSGNTELLDLLKKRAGLDEGSYYLPFFAGTMFWFRPDALEGLNQLNLTVNDFPLEMGQTDGTMAHALERIIPPLVVKLGYKVIKT